MRFQHKYIFLLFPAVLLLILCCRSIINTTSDLPQGRVNLYLSPISDTPANIVFTLEKIEVQNESKEWYTIFDGKKEISAVHLIGRQAFISEVFLSEGKYNKIKVRISEAGIVRGDKKLTLALPAENNEVIFPVSFRINRNESRSIFLQWDTKESIRNKYLFMPSFTLIPQKMEIRRLILYVTNTGSDTITVINRENDYVVGTIGVGRDPMGIVSSPSGDMIYVANSGSNSISVIETSHHVVIDTVPVNFGISPRELAISPDGSRLYVSNYHSNNISIIDTTSKSFLGQLPVGNNPMGITVNKSGTRIYVANSSSNSISVGDPFIMEVLRTVRMGSKPTDLLILRDRLFIANEGANTVYQVSISSFRVEKEISAGYGSHKLAMGMSETLFSSNINSNDVSVIPVSTNIVIQRIAVENKPQEMIVDRNRRKLYVANSGSNTVSVIDLVRQKLILSIPVGTAPYGLALVE